MRNGAPVGRAVRLPSAAAAAAGPGLRYSGNLEIQEKNTGGPGNKVLKGLSLIGNDLSFRQRIGDTASFRVAKGVSGSVSS
jgi:hypothetical protein